MAPVFANATPGRSSMAAGYGTGSAGLACKACNFGLNDGTLSAFSMSGCAAFLKKGFIIRF